jgi:LysM repeat protein
MTGASVSRNDSLSVLEIQIENRGVGTDRLVLWADLYDDSGNHRGRFENQQLADIPRNGQFLYGFTLAGLPNGTYRALIVGQYFSESTRASDGAGLLMEYIAPFKLPADPGTRSVLPKNKAAHVDSMFAEIEDFMMGSSEGIAFKLRIPEPGRDPEPPITNEAPENESSDSTQIRFALYTVQPGDWLSHLAERFYGDRNRFNVIFAANRDVLANADVIYPGQQIRIPQVDAEHVVYTVRPGDSLSKIAGEYYGDSTKFPEIWAANTERLQDADHLQPGQILRIPKLARSKPLNAARDASFSTNTVRNIISVKPNEGVMTTTWREQTEGR